jgi:hypothetical protein
MRSGLQRDSAARHGTEDFLQGFRAPTHALFLLYLARFIQHAVPTVAIAQIQSDRQCLLHGKIPALHRCCGANLLHAGLLFICALSTSITWERTASRPETGLLPSDFNS